MARVVVVGGGLAGAASAVRLAKLGHDGHARRAPAPGRRRRRLRRAGRLPLGRRPAATALPAVLRDLFRKSGRPLERELELVPLDPLREHRFDDGTRLALPSGSRAPSSRRSTRQLGAGLGTRSGSTTSTTRPSRGTGCAATASSAPTSPGRRQGDRGAAAQPADARTRPSAAGSRTRGCGPWRPTTPSPGGHDPRNVPAWLGLIDYLEQNFGTWTFPDGFGALAGLLAKRLGERRVTVLTATTALDLEMGADGPSGGAHRRRPGRRRPRRGRGRPAPAPRARGHVAPDACRPSRRRSPTSGSSRRRARPAARGRPPRRVRSLTVRTDGTAPRGQGAPGRCWAAGGSPRTSLVALARHGLDVRDAVETRRRPLTPRPRRAAVRARRAACCGRAARRCSDRLVTRTPLPGVLRGRRRTPAGGGWVPFVGLTAALVAEDVGPA